MKTKILTACAGLAVCGSAMAAPQIQMKGEDTSVKPVLLRYASVTKINGQFLQTSDWIYANTEGEIEGRGVATPEPAFNSAGWENEDNDFDGEPDGSICGDVCGAFGAPTPGSRWFFGDTFAWQVVVEDFQVDSSFAGQEIDEVVFSTNVLHAGDATCERFLAIFTWFEDDMDLTGTAASPIDFTTAVGAGVILEYTSDTCPDIDFDGTGDSLESSALGYFNFLADDFIASAIAPLVPADGVGTLEMTYAQDFFDTDFDGVNDTITVSTRVSPMLWGTAAPQTALDGVSPLAGAPGCPGEGISTGALWGEGQNTLFDPLFPTLNQSWSDATDGNGNTTVPGVVDGVYNPAIDFATFETILPDPDCPDPLSAAVFFTAVSGGSITDCNGNGIEDADDISGGTSLDINGDAIPDECAEGQNRACADVNNDGDVTAADFTAWLSAFNALPMDRSLCLDVTP